MKIISKYIGLLFLIVVLAISPLQASYAALVNCSEMMSKMHHEVQSPEERHSSKESMKENMKESGQDCCNQNKCASAQCASTVMAVIPSISIRHIEYVASHVIQIHNQSISSYFQSSIYRPPKS